MRPPTRKPVVVLLAVLLLSAALAGVASARPAAHRSAAGTVLAGQGIDALAARLELTPEQRQEIRAIVARNLPLLEVHLGDVVDTRRALFAAIHQHPATETAVRAAAADVADAEVELAVLRAEIAGDVHLVLTPEQQAELAAVAGEVQTIVDHALEVLASLTRLRLGA